MTTVTIDFERLGFLPPAVPDLPSPDLEEYQIGANRGRPKGKGNKSTLERKQGILNILTASPGEAMTVRHIFYKLLPTGYIEKTENGYDSVVRDVRDMRLASIIPFERIIDTSRSLAGSWSDYLYQTPFEYLRSQKQTYSALGLWWKTPYRVQLWCEKAAIVPIIESVCDRYGVRLVPTKGYASLDIQRQAYLEHRHNADIPLLILHLSDYDEDGLIMLDAIRKNVAILSDGMDVRFKRIGLTVDQIKELNIPHRPPKSKKDSRVPKCIGGIAADLDALENTQLRAIIQTELEALMPSSRINEIRGLNRIRRNEMDGVLEDMAILLERHAPKMLGDGTLDTTDKLTRAEQTEADKATKLARDLEFYGTMSQYGWSTFEKRKFEWLITNNNMSPPEAAKIVEQESIERIHSDSQS